MNHLIQVMAQSLVDNPGGVIVSEIQGDQTTVLELKVDKGDVGKIIGKQGRIATAMRTILNAASSRNRRRMILEIIE